MKSKVQHIQNIVDSIISYLHQSTGGKRTIASASMDGLTGFVEPSIQHFLKLRYSAAASIKSGLPAGYVRYKDIKQFTADLKPVYKAPTEEIALVALDEFEAKWSKKYLLEVKSWRVNWNELSTMFKY